jgi:hypothetical protein
MREDEELVALALRAGLREAIVETPILLPYVETAEIPNEAYPYSRREGVASSSLRGNLGQK